MRTAFALIGIFILVAAWDDFMAALIDAHPQPIHPFSFSNGSVGEALAGSLLLTPLVIAAFLFAWHYFAKSRAPRAVKAG
jgi:ABC-type glycerol-3-phosphate transport system permease component